ncbi:MAG: TPM domain-containing protein [Stomatobaculum sp.]|nr:TPM domain-containing protein [Stomatobaculum sp.]
MYECPRCGGELRFDIASQKLLCAHCKSATEYTDLKEESTAKESGEAYIFHCPNCGGQIMSTNLTAADYCTYCGAFAVLEREKGSFRRADNIIPFKKTKEEVKDLYAKTVAKKIYAPSAMRDPAFLDRFRGIYMPYWLYDVKLGPDIRFTAKTHERDGNYNVEKTHELTCESEVSFDGVPYDASSTLRDTLGQAVTPFETKDMIPYTPAVMLGFFADRADTPAKTYAEDARNAAAETAFDRITEAAGFRDPKPEKPENMKTLRGNMKVRLEKTRSAFLPVWFLTWRKNDRVSYSVVNGQTGEVCAELPVDFRKYLLFSLLTAVPLFALIYCILTITPYTMLFLSGILAAGMGQVYTRQLTAIARRELHAEDKGYLAVNPEAEKRLKESAAGKEGFLDALLELGGLILKELPFFSFCVIALFLYILVPRLGSDGSGRIVSGIAVIIITFFVFLRGREIAGDIQQKEAVNGGMGAILAAFAAAVITMVRPVSDLWYYGGSVFALLGILFSVFCLIRYYNLLVTSPIPHFFERNVGDGLEKAYEAAGETGEAGTAAKADEKANQTGEKAGKEGKTGKAGKAGKTGSVIVKPAAVIGICLLILAGAFMISEVTGFGFTSDFSTGKKTYENNETGYFAYLADDADLFNKGDEERLAEQLIPITEYGNAAVVTAYVQGQNTSNFAKDAYISLFGNGVSGTIFIIDMGNRNIWICSDGEIYKTITKGYANIICDNVYRHATKGRYYKCASEALSQITVLLDGGKIARPMKLITSVLLALLLSCILNYWMVTLTVGVEPPTADVLAGGVIGSVAASNAAQKIIRTKRTYDPPSKGGGGGGGHGF